MTSPTRPGYGQSRPRPLSGKGRGAGSLIVHTGPSSGLDGPTLPLGPSFTSAPGLGPGPFGGPAFDPAGLPPPNAPLIAYFPQLTGPALPGPGPPVVPTGEQTGFPGMPSRRIKLSAILDQTSEAELQHLPRDRLNQMFLHFSRPAQDHEPTGDQLSALAQVISYGCPPYADFSLFGPFGNCMLRRIMFTSFKYNPGTGEYQRQELYGPPDFASWWKSWVVLRTALLMLGEVRPQPLDLYADHIRKLHDQYGAACWWLIYAADARMRSE